jgi:hypothetical protein
VTDKCCACEETMTVNPTDLAGRRCGSAKFHVSVGASFFVLEPTLVVCRPKVTEHVNIAGEGHVPVGTI